MSSYDANTGRRYSRRLNEGRVRFLDLMDGDFFDKYVGPHLDPLSVLDAMKAFPWLKIDIKNCREKAMRTPVWIVRPGLG